MQLSISLQLAMIATAQLRQGELILRLICFLSKSGEISKLDIGRVRLE